MKSGEANKFIRKVKREIAPAKAEETSTGNDGSSILNNWKFGQYVSVFEEVGFMDVDDWPNLTFEELTDETMKPAHAAKFLRKVKQMKPHFIQVIDQQLKQITQTNNTNNNRISQFVYAFLEIMRLLQSKLQLSSLNSNKDQNQTRKTKLLLSNVASTDEQFRKMMNDIEHVNGAQKLMQLCGWTVVTPNSNSNINSNSNSNNDSTNTNDNNKSDYVFDIENVINIDDAFELYSYLFSCVNNAIDEFNHKNNSTNNNSNSDNDNNNNNSETTTEEKANPVLVYEELLAFPKSYLPIFASLNSQNYAIPKNNQNNNSSSSLFF
jgi:hypothetical protein